MFRMCLHSFDLSLKNVVLLMFRELRNLFTRLSFSMFCMRKYSHRLRCNFTNLLNRLTSTKAAQNEPTYDVIECTSQRVPGCGVLNNITKPPYVRNGNSGELSMGLFVKKLFSTKSLTKSDEMIGRIYEACRIGRKVLNHVGVAVQPGVSTADLDFVAHQLICEHDAYPSPLGYKNFPNSICTSVNNVVVHGIPDSRELVEGDIVNVDISVYLNGVHGDLSEMFTVGRIDDAGRHLVDITKKCLDDAIAICGPGERLSLIGKTISSLAEKRGFSVCPHFVGHGIGTDFHESPQILHQYNDFPGTMCPQMVFTIEPVLCEGKSDVVYWDDGWTVVTADRKRAAQFEHTVCITESGTRVLTHNDLNDSFLQVTREGVQKVKKLLQDRQRK